MGQTNDEMAMILGYLRMGWVLQCEMTPFEFLLELFVKTSPDRDWWRETPTSGQHDDAIKWKQFLRYWPFVRGIHRSPVGSPHKGQWREALFSLICAWTNGWANNRGTGDLRYHYAHYDVIVMMPNKTVDIVQMESATAFISMRIFGILVKFELKLNFPISPVWQFWRMLHKDR